MGVKIELFECYAYKALQKVWRQDKWRIDCIYWLFKWSRLKYYRYALYMWSNSMDQSLQLFKNFPVSHATRTPSLIFVSSCQLCPSWSKRMQPIMSQFNVILSEISTPDCIRDLQPSVLVPTTGSREWSFRNFPLSLPEIRLWPLPPTSFQFIIHQSSCSSALYLPRYWGLREINKNTVLSLTDKFYHMVFVDGFRPIA